MVAAGMNTVRVPLGFWIIEDIVDTSHESYARGGLDELVRVSFRLILLARLKHRRPDPRPQYV